MKGGRDQAAMLIPTKGALGKPEPCAFECVIFSLTCAEGGGWLLLSLPHGVSATPSKNRGDRRAPLLPRRFAELEFNLSPHRELKSEIVS